MGYRVAVVGATGNVGREILNILAERQFPLDELAAVASASSTGDVIDPAWTWFAFPPLWHYDILRALDYLRAAGVKPEVRLEEAVAIVRGRRQPDGRWLLDVRHPDTLFEHIAGAVGAPNRWITLRALRVLDWFA